MHVDARPFRLPKSGSQSHENEDACWPDEAIVEANQRTLAFKCAVADGAFASDYSREWAELLVQAYGRGDLRMPRQLARVLPYLERRWHAAVDKDRANRSTRLPDWIVHAEQQNGMFAAFAALLGLQIRWRTWLALAVGDACLFQVRDDDLVTRFPLTHSSECTDNPYLVSSDPRRNKDLAAHIKCANGEWKSGDEFYLMTDALACWFLSSYENGAKPWHAIRSIDVEGDTAFAEWIEGLRSAKALKDDDVTALRLKLT